MLINLFPKAHMHYRSLPLFGSVLDDFDEWLSKHGFAVATRRHHVRCCAHIETYFRKRKVRKITALSIEEISRCRQYFICRSRGIELAAGRLQRFLQERQLLVSKSCPASKVDRLVSGYRKYLTDVKGFSSATIKAHCRSAREFLQTAEKSGKSLRTDALNQKYIEKFICKVSIRLGRGTLQHVAAHVRGLLRYLAMLGKIPAGLETQVDTPRTYRLEQLPKSMPWQVVCKFVESIDRENIKGLRDYAMFLLIATYGLRASDVAGLRLEDIDWRAGEIRFNQRKTKYPLKLPLYDQVSEALLAYLRKGRPCSSYREVFLTIRAPIAPVTIHTIGPAFCSRVKSSKLPIPFRGVHCLRHSYAMNLLRSGASLKEIGDILGHHSTESTCVYIRLNLEELREVSLPLPILAKKESTK